MSDSIIWWDGILGFIWLIFWAFDTRSYLKPEKVADILTPGICKLAASGFTMRMVGGLDNIEFLSYLGSAIVCVAIYKIYKAIQTNNDQAQNAN